MGCFWLPTAITRCPHQQQLTFNPHVHCLVSGGGISEDATTWHPARLKFLVPIKALAKLVRGKFRALLQRKLPDLVIADAVASGLVSRGESSGLCRSVLS